MIRNKVHTASDLDAVGSDMGIELLGGNVFLESVRVDFGRVGVGGSVCFGKDVGVMASREL